MHGTTHIRTELPGPVDWQCEEADSIGRLSAQRPIVATYCVLAFTCAQAHGHLVSKVGEDGHTHPWVNKTSSFNVVEMTTGRFDEGMRGRGYQLDSPTVRRAIRVQVRLLYPKD